MVSTCPQCQSENPPIFCDEDVSLTINWFYLRCLANWADAFAREHNFGPKPQAVLNKILEQLRAMKPENGVPLTLREEIFQLTRDRPDLDVQVVSDKFLKITKTKGTIH